METDFYTGLVLNFGAYDISGFLPQAWHFDLPLVLDVDIMIKFISSLHLHLVGFELIEAADTPMHTSRT